MTNILDEEFNQNEDLRLVMGKKPILGGKMTNKELDKWLAENVMGWFVYNMPGIEHPDLQWYGDKYGEGLIEDVISENLYRRVKDWHPTESISDAFQVVEKMMEKLLYFDIQIDSVVSSRNPHSFSCIVKCYKIGADTLPLAICLAAKKAIEGEK